MVAQPADPIDRYSRDVRHLPSNVMFFERARQCDRASYRATKKRLETNFSGLTRVSTVPPKAESLRQMR